VGHAASAAKLQLVQSPTFRSAPMAEGAFPSRGGMRSGGLTWSSGFGAKKKTGLERQRVRSASSLEVGEVRLLADDAPVKEGTAHLQGPHDALLQRLKSRAARQEAESTRRFLADYRADANISQASEAKLDSLLKSTAQRAEELKQRSEDLKQEVTEAERKLEKVNGQNAGRATDMELSSMNAFERSQRRIQEDKREEDLQKQRDEVQANYAKVHRRLQNELIELRDFKVLLREFKRVRLDKLHETLGQVTDGRRLRQCVREMIRHGAQRILQKLEAAQLPLDPWMNEVLVNCCHLELQIEQSEDKLLHIRRAALKPIEDNVHALLGQTKKERFESLCFWSDRPPTTSQGGTGSAGGTRAESQELALRRQSADGAAGAAAALSDASAGEGHHPHFPADSGAGPRVVDDQVLQDMERAEAQIQSLRRLLNDTRNNAASVICNRIRQVDKGSGGCSRDATDWGFYMLSMLVSEDFAKVTVKEMQKSAPHAKLTQ